MMMSFGDMLLAGAVFVGALWYLYRKIVKDRGCTCGSSSCPISKEVSPHGDVGSGFCDRCGSDNKEKLNF